MSKRAELRALVEQFADDLADILGLPEDDPRPATATKRRIPRRRAGRTERMSEMQHECCETCTRGLILCSDCGVTEIDAIVAGESDDLTPMVERDGSMLCPTCAAEPT